jgi:ABC-type nickel/cobalt efflux system permease component RcnA
LLLLGLQALTPVALAHPVGNISVNQYVGLHLTSSLAEVDYVVDMAEIPALQVLMELRAGDYGPPDPKEVARYHQDQCEALGYGLRLLLNGQPAALAMTNSTVEFPPGQGGLLTLRLSCAYHAPLELREPGATIEFENLNYADRLGWREIVATADGVTLSGDYAARSASQRLTSFPTDLLNDPLDQRQVSLEARPGGATPFANQPASSAAPTSGVEQPAGRDDAFTRLVSQADLTPPAVALALAIAIGWGALHALTPGHGKTVVGAYLVGSRGTTRHALWLGLATTVTHTAGVFALGLVALLASRYIMPEQLFPWLSLASGLMVVAIGVRLFASRLSGLAPPRAREGVSHEQHGHPHDHSHDEDHSHSHVHDHDHLEGPGHSHDHDGHSHLPPGADGSPPTWRSLLALGISGGLLPCPSAMVVMLGAIALDRIGYGLALVMAFSLGLAGALTVIGLLFLYAGRATTRLPVPGRARRLIPAASALFITVVGLSIALNALAEIGLAR